MEHSARGLRARRLRLLPLLLVLLCTCLVPLACLRNPNRGGILTGTPIVRVLLLENRSRVDLAASLPPIVHLGSGQSQKLKLSGIVSVTLTESGWAIGNANLGHGELTIESSTGGTVAVDKHAYRGRYRFVPRGGGRFDVINDVDVDSYLKSVVSKELLWNWHDEAYRAQAIAARTYALYVSRTASAGSSYDLFADVRSQVYGGISAESTKSRNAVDTTRGMVVAYGPPGQERIFKAYFSSCCGGISQSAASAFGDPPSEPLSERNVGRQCARAPRYNWGPIIMKKKEITRRLHAWGGNVPALRGLGDVTRIEVQSANRYGRPEKFAITDARGTRYTLSSEDFRHALNTDASDGITLPSSFFRPLTEGDAVRFADGHGFGHGVGLCQWCAEEQSEAGVSHEKILLSAFPGAVLLRAY